MKEFLAKGKKWVFRHLIRVRLWKLPGQAWTRSRAGLMQPQILRYLQLWGMLGSCGVKLLYHLTMTYSPITYCCMAPKLDDLNNNNHYIISPMVRGWPCLPRQVLVQYLSCSCSQTVAGAAVISEAPLVVWLAVDDSCQMGSKPTCGLSLWSVLRVEFLAIGSLQT